MKLILAICAFAFASFAFAQDVPVPKVLNGMQGKEKGRWQMEMLEGGKRAARGMSITICTDNLIDQAANRGKKGESSCKHQLVKDTADEAVVQSECHERKTTTTLKREGESMLITMEGSGPKGPQTMKMRAKNLGPCRESQGPNSN